MSGEQEHILDCVPASPQGKEHFPTPALYINREVDKDRRASIEAELSNAGIRGERICGVDGEAKSPFERATRLVFAAAGTDCRGPLAKQPGDSVVSDVHCRDTGRREPPCTSSAEVNQLALVQVRVFVASGRKRHRGVCHEPGFGSADVVTVN